MHDLFHTFQDKRILVTGHTGFKGSWLTRILTNAGAEVSGLALKAEPNSLYEVCGELGEKESTILDIRNRELVDEYFSNKNFDGIFHLAAQPLVLRSYKEPVETFDTNVMGTAHVLNGTLQFKASPWVVVVTTDKVYENVEKLQGYVEDDALGGKDPYSASKSATEMVVKAWRNLAFADGTLKINSARAGNVIGGGDTAENRLLPDLIRGFMQNKKTTIRNPDSVRPWQHVLDPLSGYLMMGQKLIKGESIPASLNFGPSDDAKLTVKEMAEYACDLWADSAGFEVINDPNAPSETGLLWLSSTLAKNELGWVNKLDARTAIRWTLDWHRNVKNSSAPEEMDRQIAAYFKMNP